MTNSFSQDSTSVPEEFTIKLENKQLIVWNNEKQQVYKRTFSNPKGEDVDLDDDNVDEYALINKNISEGRSFYTLYIFNTIDSFFVADSINSGLMEPQIIYSNEVKKMVLLTGNEKFDSFNADSDEVFLPLNTWKYDNAKVFSLNDELYDLFITTNDSLADFIDSYFDNYKKDCKSTGKLKAAIAEVYANYLTAGEKSLAEEFLKKYYYCSDVGNFKNKIITLLGSR